MENEAGNSTVGTGKPEETCDFTRIKDKNYQFPESCSCLIVQTKSPNIAQSSAQPGLTMPELLMITGIVILVMLVIIDLSCHYMNECGIFSTILLEGVWGFCF